MSDRDRIIALERTLRELLTNQLAHLPARWGESSGGDSETFRLIRGESVGAQSGATVLIDNVDVLAGGEDPTNGDPGVQVTVQNIWGQSYTDNEKLQAIYNEDLGGTDLTDWENIKSTGTERYRAIRGLAVGAVTANMTSFSIDNVIPLAGGNDPVSGNPATTVTVENIQKEAFADNTPITAIYDGTNWEVLLVERYRVIRGKATASVSAGAGTFTIDGIDVIAGSVDPRSDPTSETEAITVRKTWPDRYLDNADVFAGHNPRTSEWEVMSRGGSANELTIKSPTSIELTITGTAPNQKLDVKLNYKEYTVFAEEGADGNMHDDLDADPFVCP